VVTGVVAATSPSVKGGAVVQVARRRVSVSSPLLEILRALADPIRLEIVSLCAVEECACTLLEEVLPVAKSTISYHISVLYHARLLEVRKDGRFYHYRLRRDTIETHLPGFVDKLVDEERFLAPR
jgi:DNA-binding transcriptional ArsR family regulator